MMFATNVSNIATHEANIKGQSEALDNVDFDAMTRELADSSRTRAKLLLDEKEVEALRDARAEAQEKQSNMDTAEQASNIAKNIPQGQQ